MSDAPTFYLGVDYELFFGHRHGSVEACLIEPTEALVQTLEKHQAYLTVFADVGYLCALKREQVKHPQLLKDRNRVLDQLKWLVERGHDVQLHVHPHWEDCVYTGDRWLMDTTRYRLQNFDDTDLCEIVSRYTQVLIDDVGHKPCAYRAGGWCITPFPRIGAALRSSGVWIDSTVYAGGISSNPNREFDFTTAPCGDKWSFDDDPNRPAQGGYFLEVPISALNINPGFWIRGELRKRLQPDRFKRHGDGEALSNTGKYYADRLLKKSVIPVSIDEYRAASLFLAYDQLKRNGLGVLNAMGHPKAITRDSVQTLDRFLTERVVEPAHFSHINSRRLMHGG